MYEMFIKQDNEHDYILAFSDRVPLPTLKLAYGNLHLEENTAGSFEFALAPTNVAYNSIFMMKSTVLIKKDGVRYWEGRPISEEIDFWKNRVIYCEGELAYLNDTTQPQMEYTTPPKSGQLFNATVAQFLEAVLNFHNEKVDESKQFHLGVIYDTTEHSWGDKEVQYRYTQYEKTMETVNNLAEEMNAKIRVAWRLNSQNVMERQLDFLADYTGESGQEIIFGTNLSDFTKSYDFSEFCSVLLPLGEVDDSLSPSATKINHAYHLGYVIDKDDNDNIYIHTVQDQRYWVSVTGITGSGPDSIFADPSVNKYFYKTSMQGNYGYMLLINGQTGEVLYSWFHSGDNYEIQEGEIDFSQIGGFNPSNNDYIVIAGFDHDSDAIPMHYLTTDDKHYATYDGGLYLLAYNEQDYIKYQPMVSEAIDNFLTIETVNDGSMYLINDDALAEYGWIEKQITFTNVDDPAVLKSKAQDYLEKGQFDGMTLEVTAVDMRLMGLSADSFTILSQTKVVSPPHGMNMYLPCTEIDVDICDPSGMTVTLGKKTEQNLTDVNNSVNEDLLAKIEAIPSYSQTLESARQIANSILHDGTTGKVSLVKNPGDQYPSQIIISTLYDYTAPEASGIILNSNGIGAWTGGWNPSSHIEAAMTIDGHIYAEQILGGTMTGQTINANRVNLGVLDDGSGSIIAYNNGSKIAELDKRGFATYNGSLYWSFIRDGQFYGGNGDIEFDSITGEITNFNSGIHGSLRLGDNKGLMLYGKDYIWTKTKETIVCANQLTIADPPSGSTTLEEYYSNINNADHGVTQNIQIQTGSHRRDYGIGMWESDRTYSLNERVYLSNTVYKSLRNNNGQSLADTSAWQSEGAASDMIAELTTLRFRLGILVEVTANQ